MKKWVSLFLLLSSLTVYADNSQTNMPGMNSFQTMYFNFGIGVGGASDWNQNSLALNAMTMGVYMTPNFAIETGMDALPDGANSAGQAMIMSYHVAVKGVLPLFSAFSVYTKLGLGINAYEGESPAQNMAMVNQVSAGLYYAGGIRYDFNSHFGIYLEESGIAVPNIGNNGNTNSGSFGTTYQGTLGLEVRM
jgi:hypothetical protein